MRTLSATLCQLLTQESVVRLQLSNLAFKHSKLLVSDITFNLQVLNSVVVFYAILVMNYLPRMKASTEMLRHRKAVFKNCTITFCHSVKEIVRLQCYQDVAIAVYSTSTFPSRVLISTIMDWCFTVHNVSTTITIFRRRLPILQQYPSRLTTTFTWKPLVTVGFSRFIYFLTLFDVTYLYHNNIILENGRNIQVGCHNA